MEQHLRGCGSTAQSLPLPAVCAGGPTVTLKLQSSVWFTGEVWTIQQLTKPVLPGQECAETSVSDCSTEAMGGLCKPLCSCTKCCRASLAAWGNPAAIRFKAKARGNGGWWDSPSCTDQVLQSKVLPLFCTGPDLRPWAALRQSSWPHSGPAHVWHHMNFPFAGFPGSNTAAAGPVPSSTHGIWKIKTESWTCSLVHDFILPFCCQ